MKKLSHFIVLTFCLAIQLQYGSGQPSHLSFQHLTSVDGLPSDQINALLQDSKGFIWIGTDDGLVRYDGSELKVYKAYENPSLGLVTNWIDALHEDLDSNLVIYSAGTIPTLYDPKMDSRSDKSERDTSLLELNNTKFYVTTKTSSKRLCDPVLDSIAKNDPYVKNGVVKFWEIRKWTVVIGDEE